MGGGGGRSNSASTSTNTTTNVTKSITDSYNSTVNKVRNINRTGGTKIYVSGKNAAAKVPDLLAATKGPSSKSASSESGSDWPTYVMMLATLATVGILLLKKR